MITFIFNFFNLKIILVMLDWINLLKILLIFSFINSIRIGLLFRVKWLLRISRWWKKFRLFIILTIQGNKLVFNFSHSVSISQSFYISQPLCLFLFHLGLLVFFAYQIVVLFKALILSHIQILIYIIIIPYFNCF